MNAGDDALPPGLSQTFAKGLAVLRAFDETQSHLTLAEVARRAGLDRAAARRLVLTLAHLGYVRQQGRVFSLTPRVLILAGGFLRGHRFGIAVQPVLAAAAARVGEQVALAMPDGEYAVYVAQAAPAGGLVSLGLTLGSRVPLGLTAIGQAMLAFMERPPANTAPPHGLAGVRRAGFAFVDGAFEPGMAGLAVPVGSGGRAAVGMSAPSARLAQGPSRSACLATLREAARALAPVVEEV